MIKVGEHLTLDIIGTKKVYEASFFEDLVHKIAHKAKVTVLNAVRNLMLDTEVSDAVRLNAAKDLLSRGGTDATTRSEVETTTKISDLTDEEIDTQITELTRNLKVVGGTAVK